MLEIKRYPNRKLYMKGGYVSLSQVADFLRDGIMVQVLDSESGRDVTGYTLAQLIAQQAEHGRTFSNKQIAQLVSVAASQPVREEVAA